MTGGLILSIAYGIDVQGQNDPLLKAADTAVGAINATLVPGAYLVDLFPICEFSGPLCVKFKLNPMWQ